MMNRLQLTFILIFFLSACGPSSSNKVSTDPKVVVFFGDSLTAGKGVSPEDAYPALIQKTINEEGWNTIVVNAGVGGDTSADGLKRIETLFVTEPKIDVFVLALGANDILQRLGPRFLEENLNAVLQRVKRQYPHVQLVVAGVEFGFVLGMFAPKDIDELFERVAKKAEARLIPNLLKGVVGKPQCNVSDGIHPNAQGHQIIAKTVWKKIKMDLRPSLR